MTDVITHSDAFYACVIFKSVFSDDREVPSSKVFVGIIIGHPIGHNDVFVAAVIFDQLKVFRAVVVVCFLTKNKFRLAVVSVDSKRRRHNYSHQHNRRHQSA